MHEVLQSRSKDILIACIDGLKALPEAIKTIFSEVKIQLCIIHMIRNSMKDVSKKYAKEFMVDLKEVYGAATLELAERNLERFQIKWKNKLPTSGEAMDCSLG